MIGSPGHDLSKLLDCVYAGVLDPGAWPKFLKHLSDRVDAVGAQLVAQVARHADQQEIAAWGEQASIGLSAVVRRRKEYVHSINLYFHQAAARAKPLVQSTIQSLKPHLARALDISKCVSKQNHHLNLLSSIADSVPYGIVIAEQDGEVLAINSAAREITGIVGCTIEADVRMAMPNEAARRSDGVEPRRVKLARALNLPTQARGENYHVSKQHAVIVPVFKRLSADLTSPVSGPVLVLLGQSPSSRSIDPALLVQFFELTPAEARLVALLANNFAPDRVAKELAVSLHTVRSQIRSVYGKVGVTRQLDLIAVVHQSSVSCAAS